MSRWVVVLPGGAARVPLRSTPVRWYEAGTDGDATDLEVVNTGSDAANPLMMASAAGLEVKVGAGSWTDVPVAPTASPVDLGSVAAGGRLAIQVRASLAAGSYRVHPIQILFDLGV